MDRQQALDAALSHIERQFGKGSVMKMNDHAAVSIGAVAPSDAAAFLSRLHPSGALYEVLESFPLNRRTLNCRTPGG